MWVNLSEWVKNMKISVFHMNAHWNVTQKRRILIIKLIEWPVLWIPVSLFPQPPLSSPNGLMNKVAVVAGMEGMHWLSNIDFHQQRLALAIVPAEFTIYQQQRSTQNLRHAPFPTVISQLWWQVDYFGLLPSWKGCVCSYWNRHLLLIQICLPSTQCI